MGQGFLFYNHTRKIVLQRSIGYWKEGEFELETLVSIMNWDLNDHIYILGDYGTKFEWRNKQWFHANDEGDEQSQSDNDNIDDPVLRVYCLPQDVGNVKHPIVGGLDDDQEGIDFIQEEQEQEVKGQSPTLLESALEKEGTTVKEDGQAASLIITYLWLNDRINPPIISTTNPDETDRGGRDHAHSSSRGLGVERSRPSLETETNQALLSLE